MYCFEGNFVLSWDEGTELHTYMFHFLSYHLYPYIDCYARYISMSRNLTSVLHGSRLPFSSNNCKAQWSSAFTDYSLIIIKWLTVPSFIGAKVSDINLNCQLCERKTAMVKVLVPVEHDLHLLGNSIAVLIKVWLYLLMF